MPQKVKNGTNGTSTEAQAWTPKQQQVIEWLAVPKGVRQPSTQEELATQIGVTRRTISRWKKLPGFQEAVCQRSCLLLRDRLPDVLGKLGDLAEAGNLQAIKLVLKAAGLFDQPLLARPEEDEEPEGAEKYARRYGPIIDEIEEWERNRTGEDDLPTAWRRGLESFLHRNQPF